jgi:2-polyprenyl-3-methyl-5-hydroxy-6-metoxy-1,4-benzoquinol methylase
MINKCRFCKDVLPEKPLLKLFNMPESAQNFPTKFTLTNDKGIDLEIYQCKSCGLVQLAIEPVPYYRDVIRAAAFSQEMREFRLKQFKYFVDRYNLQGKKVIEIGCGKGEYLELMNQSGALAFGLEHLLESVEFCKQKGLKVERGFIESSSYKLQNSPFDAFFVLNFLEHIPDMNSFLKGIANNLHDEAIGLVEVPNFDMIIEKKLFSEFIPDHLYYFTEKTLTLILEMNGFDILECKEVWYDYIISAVVKKKKQVDLSHFYEYHDLIKKELESFIDQYNNVAVWGAGHQALAILALTNISKKIRYVIDSATFKQGKLTPVTHLPIVAPEVIKNDGVDAIIVMAASYSDEVAKIIQEDYTGVRVAVLRDFGLEILD